MCVHMLIRKCESAGEGDTGRTTGGEIEEKKGRYPVEVFPVHTVLFTSVS